MDYKDLIRKNNKSYLKRIELIIYEAVTDGMIRIENNELEIIDSEEINHAI
jgi:hypothetical protein